MTKDLNLRELPVIIDVTVSKITHEINKFTFVFVYKCTSEHFRPRASRGPSRAALAAMLADTTRRATVNHVDKFLHNIASVHETLKFDFQRKCPIKVGERADYSGASVRLP